MLPLEPLPQLQLGQVHVRWDRVDLTARVVDVPENVTEAEDALDPIPGGKRDVSILLAQVFGAN
jgi:hypothetical protein